MATLYDKVNFGPRLAIVIKDLKKGKMRISLGGDVKNSMVVSRDPSLFARENYMAALEKFLKKLGWHKEGHQMKAYPWRGADIEGGAVFVAVADIEYINADREFHNKRSSKKVYTVFIDNEGAWLSENSAWRVGYEGVQEILYSGTSLDDAENALNLALDRAG